MSDKFEKLNFSLAIEEDDTEKIIADYIMKSRTANEKAKEIGFSKEQLLEEAPFFYEYVKSKKFCEKCPGISNCSKEHPLTEVDLKNDNGVLVRSYFPCKLQRDFLKTQLSFNRRSFPEEWLECSIKKDLDKTNSRAKVVKIYSDYINSKSNNWIYITGTKNTGKTFLASILCVDAARRDLHPICFVNTKECFDELRNDFYKDKDAYLEQLVEVADAKILVLDDFGDEEKVAVNRDEILKKIIDYRYKNNLFTIFVSRHDLEKVETLYSVSKAAELSIKDIIAKIRRKCGQEISLGELAIY